MPDELRSPLEKALVAPALSIQTPGELGSESSWHWPSCQEEASRWLGFNKLTLMNWLSSSGLSVHQAEPSQVQPNPRLSPQRTVKEHVQLTTHWGPSMEDKVLVAGAFIVGLLWNQFFWPPSYWGSSGNCTGPRLGVFMYITFLPC